MMKQFAVLAVFSTTSTLMGCAQTVGGPDWSILSSGLGGPVEAAQLRDESAEKQDIHAPTVANKTLSAIALERATGLKPVPSRLVKFD